MIYQMYFLHLLLFIATASQEEDATELEDLDKVPTDGSTVSTNLDYTFLNLQRLNNWTDALLNDFGSSKSTLERVTSKHSYKPLKKNSDRGKDRQFSNREIRSFHTSYSNQKNASWQSPISIVINKNRTQYSEMNMATSLKENDPCTPDVVVRGMNEMTITISTEKNIALYCKAGENFKYIEIFLKIHRWTFNRYPKTRVTAEELGMEEPLNWNRINIEGYIDYEYWNEWFVKVSVDGNERKKISVDYVYSGDRFKSIIVKAKGPSIWKYSKPNDQCPDEVSTTAEPFTTTTASTTDDSNSTASPFNSETSAAGFNNPNLLIIVVPIICIIVFLIALTIIALLHHRFRRNNLEPRVNLQLRETGAGKSPGTGLQPGTRPESSHDSENSLYGVIEGNNLEPNVNRQLRETGTGNSSGADLQPGMRPGSSHDSENSLYGVVIR